MSVTGVTSIPTTFAAALSATDRYEHQIATLAKCGERNARELFWALALSDVQTAADLLTDVHARTADRDGFVSFVCTPDVADDPVGTVRQAADLYCRTNRRNVMIKVPGSAAGVDAIKLLPTVGINFNVTLLFSVDRYSACLDAYQAGLEARLALGSPVAGVALDAILPDGSDLRGEVALARGTDLRRHHNDRHCRVLQAVEAQVAGEQPEQAPVRRQVVAASGASQPS